MQNTFKLMQVLDNLARMPRTGGVLFAGINPVYGDSLAEHSYKVVWISLLISSRLERTGKEFDRARLLTAAVTHDWNEAVLLDIPSGSPSYASYFETNIRDTVKNAELNVNQEINEFIKEEVTLNIGSKDLSTVEKAVLECADISALLLELLEWKYSGLKYDWIDYMWANSFKRLKTRIESDLPEIKDLLENFTKAYTSENKSTNPFLTKPQFQNKEHE
jgi:putative hydrolase of HD superfamily